MKDTKYLLIPLHCILGSLEPGRGFANYFLRCKIFHFLNVLFCWFVLISSFSYLDAKPFQFTDVVRVKNGASFSVWKETKIGKGKIIAYSTDLLRFQISLGQGTLNGSATVSLKKLSEDKQNIYFRLELVGTEIGRPVKISETVSADRFLAENGMLSFRYDNAKRYLQLSIHDGLNVAVTEYGAAKIIPD